MNQTNLSRLLLPFLFVPLAVAAIINLLTTGGNQLGNAFFMLILFGAGLGLVAPRAGLLLFIVLQFYVDFLKRLLILGDSLSNQDVMVSLGMGPVIVVAACITCALHCLTGKVPFFNLRDLIFFTGCVGVSLLGLFLGGGSGPRGFVDIAQSLLGSSMLGMTAYATYILVRERTDQHKVLNYIIFGAVPMALYAFYQYFHGISGWEELYIRTGLSRVLYSFYLIDGIDGMRPFSTLNTHTSLGAVSATMFLIASLLMMRAKRLFGASSSHWMVYLFLSFLYLGSCYLSKNRTTYALPVLGFLLVFMFSGGWRALFFYLSSLAFFIWIVKNSEWLNTAVLDWSGQMEGTRFGAAFGTLGTYQARLGGFIHLADPNNWTPFGMAEEVRPLAHDQITETLLAVGYVPLFGIFLIGSAVMFWWHRRCLRFHDPAERSLLVALTATIVSLGICSLAYGNLLFVAPVNSLLGLLIGLGMVSIRRDQAEKKALASATPAPQVATDQGARMNIGPLNANRS